MSGRRSASDPLPIALRGVAFDAAMVALWRFGWKHTWAASLLFGGILLTFTAALTTYAWWWKRHPEIEMRMRAKKEARARTRY